MKNLEHPIEVKIGYCAFFSQKNTKSRDFWSLTPYLKFIA